LRYIPALHSSGGVSEALARVQDTVTDPDMLAEATAELAYKGTPLDPVLLAIKAAAQSNVDRYGLPDMTEALLAIEAQANAFLALSEALFGSKDSPSFRTMVALGPDGRLSGFRRREGLVSLRQLLVPTASVPANGEVDIFLWMLANREIDLNEYTAGLWQLYLESMPGDYWALQAYVDSVFIPPEVVESARSLALTAIQADLLELSTGLTPADKDTFNDALAKLASVAVTPEDRLVQFDRLRDIGQRFSNFADTVTFRYYLEVLVGGGYLAETEYYALYSTLIANATSAIPSRDPIFIKAELAALGNLNFSDTFAESLILALQEYTNGYFTEAELANFTGTPLDPIRLASGALAYDRYWTDLAGEDAKLVLDTSVVLSRTLNTLFNQDRARAIAEARLALSRLSGSIADPETASAVMEALMGQLKTPQAAQEESDFLAQISEGNEALDTAYSGLVGAVNDGLEGITSALPEASVPDLQGASAVVYYPLILFAKNNEYGNGITTVAVNQTVQGGRVLSQVGNTYTAITADPSASTPYSTTYFPQGSSDVTSQALYDPNAYTYSGENPATSFASGVTPTVSDYNPDIRTPGSASNMKNNTQSSASSMTGNLQNILCKMDMLCNLISQLNGITDAATGALVGGVNNAISGLNNTIKGLTDKLGGLLNTVGNLGSINLKVNCKCMSFDLSVNLQKLLKPISSWLIHFPTGLGFKNPLAGLKNPFHLNPNLGCPSQMLAALGGFAGFGGSK